MMGVLLHQICYVVYILICNYAYMYAYMYAYILQHVCMYFRNVRGMHVFDYASMYKCIHLGI